MSEGTWVRRSLGGRHRMWGQMRGCSSLPKLAFGAIPPTVGSSIGGRPARMAQPSADRVEADPGNHDFRAGTPRFAPGPTLTEEAHSPAVGPLVGGDSAGMQRPALMEAKRRSPATRWGAVWSAFGGPYPSHRGPRVRGRPGHELLFAKQLFKVASLMLKRAASRFTQVRYCMGDESRVDPDVSPLPNLTTPLGTSPSPRTRRRRLTPTRS